MSPAGFEPAFQAGERPQTHALDRAATEIGSLSLDRPLGLQEVKFQKFLDSRHMKAVNLSGLRTGRLYSPRDSSGTNFCQRLSLPQGHSAARRIKSMKNPTDPIGNRTRGFPACNAVPYPTAPQRKLYIYYL